MRASDLKSDLVSAGEAAGLLGVSVATLGRMRRAGEVPFVKYAGRRLFLYKRGLLRSFVTRAERRTAAPPMADILAMIESVKRGGM